jgi:hypothetical protein
MAQLNVQPKKTNPVLGILLAVIALLILFYVVKSCSSSNPQPYGQTTTASLGSK